MFPNESVTGHVVLFKETHFHAQFWLFISCILLNLRSFALLYMKFFCNKFDFRCYDSTILLVCYGKPSAIEMSFVKQMLLAGQGTQKVTLFMDQLKFGVLVSFRLCISNILCIW